MRRKQPLFFLAILSCLSAGLYAQSAIIDPSRTIDWTISGISGGIPNRTGICTTISASTFGNGSTDATSAIQSALNSCGANQVVFLPSGTYRITSLTIPSNVSLRGAGPSSTTLDLRGSGSAAVFFGNSTQPTPGTSTTVSGASKGSSSITVGSASGIANGTLLMISQQDQSYMTSQGDNGACDWCDAGWPNNMNSGQIVEVTSVSGSTVNFAPPLYTNYSNSPMAYRFTAGARNAGLESLKLFANNTGYTSNILMSGSAYCWLKGVESDFADGDHMRIYWSLRNQVRDSYFHDGFKHGPGGTDDTLVIAHKSSGNRIENNIFYRQHVSIMLEWGASGNVIAYNTSSGTYHEDWLSWMINDFNFHGAHPMFNLFEGNIGAKFQPDSTWGSSSHSTVLRNWFSGSNQYVPPINSRTSLQTSSAVWETANTFAYSIDSLSQFNNLVGNVAGSTHLLSTGAVNSVISPASGGSSPTCYRIGYVSGNDAPSNPNNAASTMVFHGNNDCVAGTIQWDSNISNHTIPSSLYLTSKPSWFGTAQWPGIGPDITGGPGPSGHAFKNPAQLCFEGSPKNSLGIPTFNPSTCYGDSGAPATLAPPTNLTATVR